VSALAKPTSDDRCVLAGAVRLSAVWVESKLDVTLAVIGVSTTTGLADALARGVWIAVGVGVVVTRGVIEAVGVSVGVRVEVGVEEDDGVRAAVGVDEAGACGEVDGVSLVAGLGELSMVRQPLMLKPRVADATAAAHV
jgi:hypothetical protein